MESADFCREVGRRVARRRRILGLTQQQVGARIGLHRSHISLLESGIYRSMKFWQLAALADALETTLDYLLLRVESDPGRIPPSLCQREGLCLSGASPLATTIVPKGDYDERESTKSHFS